MGLLGLVWFGPGRLLFLVPLMAKWNYLLLCSWESCSAMHVKGEQNSVRGKSKTKNLPRVQPSGRKCVWQVTRVVWSYGLFALCEWCLRYTLCAESWGLWVCSCEGWNGKRIKSLHVQMVVFLLNSVILPWLSLEVCRRHFRGHRSMSLPNAEFFYKLLRRLENLLWASWPVSMFVVFLELEDLFSIHKLK